MKQTSTALLLKNKTKVFESVFVRSHWPRVLAELILVGVLGSGLFGLVLSTNAFDWVYAWESTWKMMLLVWGPMAICAPSLFVFSALRGSVIRFTELLFLMVGSIATSSVVLLALTPVTWFFAWTTEGAELVAAINFLVGGVALVFGMFFLVKGLHFVHTKKKETEPQSNPATDILLFWVFLLLVVMVQMGTKLSPWYKGLEVGVEAASLF